jgi:hypothetical protein
MTKFVGRRTMIGASRETTRGTPRTTVQYWIPHASLSFDDKANKVVEDQAMGRICDSDGNYMVSRWGEGELEGQIRDDALGVILYGLFDGYTRAPIGGGDFRHTYTIANNNQHESLTLFLNEPGFCYVYPLAMVDTFKMTIEPEGIVTYAVGFKSRQSEPYKPKTPALTNLGNKFLHQHLMFRTAASIGALNLETTIKKLELTISKNVLIDFPLGTVMPDDLENQQFSVEGNIVLKRDQETDTWKQRALTTAYQAMEINLSGVTMAGTNDSQLRFQLPRVSFFEWEADRSLDSIVTESINFKGHYDAANGLECISDCRLQNRIVTYNV